MVKELVATELTKLALEKLGTVRLEDAVKVLKTLQGAPGGVLLVPGLALLGVGVVVGAGVGILLAPRPGRETREALRDAVTVRLRKLGSKLGGRGKPEAVEVEARDVTPRESEASETDPESRSRATN